MNVNLKDIPNISLPPMPKPEDFQIDWQEAGRSLGIGSPKANRQLRAYYDALAAWEPAVEAVAKSFNPNREDPHK